MQVEDYCIEEHEVVAGRETKYSPSGKYELTIHTYDTTVLSGKNTWNYTKGVVRNTETGEIITTIFLKCVLHKK